MLVGVGFYGLNLHRLDGIFYHLAGGFQHDAFSLELGQKFVPDFAFGWLAGKIKQANGADKCLAPGQGDGPINGFVLPDGFGDVADKLPGIIHRPAGLPAQVLIDADVGAQGKDSLVVVQGQLPEGQPFCCELGEGGEYALCHFVVCFVFYDFWGLRFLQT